MSRPVNRLEALIETQEKEKNRKELMKRKEIRHAAVTNTHMFSNRDLWKLMLPLSIDQLLNSMMGTVGTLVVSNLGSAAISAVSLVDAINVLVVQAFYALAAGGSVVCSQFLGCKRLRKRVMPPASWFSSPLSCRLSSEVSA